MSFVITNQDTINAIQDAYNAQNLPLAYTLVFNAITTVTTIEVPDGAPIVTEAPADGVDPAVWAWVGGAINVNTNSGAFAQYIRDYTAEQYQLRTGSTLDQARLQHVDVVFRDRGGDTVRDGESRRGAAWLEAQRDGIFEIDRYDFR